jgi:transcription antitermination factor NusG
MTSLSDICPSTRMAFRFLVLLWSGTTLSARSIYTKGMGRTVPILFFKTSILTFNSPVMSLSLTGRSLMQVQHYAGRAAAFDSNWYAIYTKHQHEKTVSKMLTVKGFETLLPLYQSVRRLNHRARVCSLPLFPCYVLVKGGLERRLDILTTPGIFAVVSRCGQPTPIATADIEYLRRAIEGGSSLEPHPFLNCGDHVRVKSGPLEGLEGILIRKKNICRLVLSVHALGKAAAVEMDASLVERLNPKATPPAALPIEGYLSSRNCHL